MTKWEGQFGKLKAQRTQESSGFAKSAEKVETARPVVANSLFGDQEVEDEIDDDEEVDEVDAESEIEVEAEAETEIEDDAQQSTAQVY